MKSLHTVLTPAELWLTIACMGAITYLLRIFFIALFGSREVPRLFRRALRFVAPAVLSALVLPSLAYAGSSLDLAASNHRLIAGAVAALAAWRTKNVAATVVVGMAVLLALNWLLR